MLTALARYVRSHHVGLVALFIALGGTAYAASLPRNSVGTKQLKRNAVTTAKVRNGTLSALDFAPGTLLRGPAGPPGSPAQLNGVAAGGALAGTFPNPTLKPGSVTPAAIGTVPSVAAFRVPGYSIPSGTGVFVSFPSELYDTANMHDPANDDEFFAPRDGLYLITGDVSFSPDADGTRSVGIHAAGGCCRGFELVPGSAGALSTSAIVPLSAGQSAQLQVFHTAGNNLDADVMRFAMQWIGPKP